MTAGQGGAVDLLVPGSLATLTGGYIYDRRICEGLAQLGWQTTVHSVDASFPEPTDAALADAGRTLAAIPDGRLLVVDGLALTGLAPFLEATCARLSLIALIHHPLALETGIDPATRARLRSGEQDALSRVSHVVVTSRWTRDALSDFGVPQARVAVVEPGVDKPAALPDVARSRELRLLCIGTVTPRKGHAVLVDALAGLDDKRWRLRCAGSLDRDPATAAALRQQIADRGLDDRIQLLGELSPADVRAEFADADLLVLPSFLEGFGMVITEAVAHGVPVLATSAGAIVHTLPAGAGLLVPPGDPTALTGRIASLLADRTQLDALTAGARTAAPGIASWQDAAVAFAQTLERCRP